MLVSIIHRDTNSALLLSSSTYIGLLLVAGNAKFPKEEHTRKPVHNI